VRLGSLSEGGLAPAILAIVERGVSRRPALASAARAEVQLEFAEGYPPVRVVFAGQHVLVEDGTATAPDLRVSGTLPDLVSLMVTPHLSGLPNPIAARGRAALGMVVFRRVRIQGRLGLLRRLLRVIAV
jgi:acetyl esterase/lipase